MPGGSLRGMSKRPRRKRGYEGRGEMT